MNDSYSNDDRPYRSSSRRDDDGYSSRRNDDRAPRRGSYGNDRGGYGGGGRRQDVRDEVFSTQVRAGRRRYFFDVRDTHSGDFYLTITEMKRAFEGGPAEKHKIFLYKEDFTKFVRGLQDTIDYVKSNLLTQEQLDDLERGDAQYEEDERYYREQREQRAAEERAGNLSSAPDAPRPAAADNAADAAADTDARPTPADDYDY